MLSVLGRLRRRWWLHLLPAAVFILSLAAVLTHGETGDATSPATAVTAAASTAVPPTVPPATPSPTPLAEPAVTPTPRPPRLRATLPLASLSREAGVLAASRRCCLAAAIVVPAEGVTFEFQGGMEFPLLSVAKVQIMLTLLDKARAEGRALTAYESRLLDQMIRASDNNAASSLWMSTGGPLAMNAYLQSAGLQPLPTNKDSWGDTIATPVYMATLMSKLFQAETLDEPNRATARRLLETVADSQNWGITAGVGAAQALGVKNGWYRDSEGAMIHSLGYVIPDQGPPYAIAVFTRANVSPLAGIKLIEELATLINNAMAARP